MYDVLTARYTFSCPTRGETSVRLSAFRLVERLPGPAHPAVYRVQFDCPCGEQHPGLLGHADLDWAPLGLDDRAGAFVNLMTDRVERLDAELGELAATRIRSGSWPWTFFCYPEERPRPVFPSSFRLLARGPLRERGLGVAVRCPVCSCVSINLVSEEHVDVPFHNDARVGVVEHVFRDDARRTLEAFHADLHGASFEVRRLQLG